MPCAMYAQCSRCSRQQAQGQRGCPSQDIGGINLFVLISAVSLLFCAPLAVVMESSQWSAAITAAQLTVGTQVT